MNESNMFLEFKLPVFTRVFKLNNGFIFTHQHQLLIIVVLIGAISIKRGDRESQYQEGDIALVNSHCEIKPLIKDTSILNIDIDTMHYKEHFPYLESAIFSEVPSHLKTRYISLLLNSAFALEEKNKDSYAIVNDNVKIILNSIINDCQFFSSRIKEHYSNPHIQLEYINLMHRILYYIHTHCFEKISLNIFSMQEHLSENYLSHLIKKISGTTFKDLIAFIRCKTAESYLLDPNCRINEIAYLTGFSTPIYFKNSFTKIYGVSPDKYRSYYANIACKTELPDQCSSLETKTVLRKFAERHNITLSLASERFFTIDTVYVDQCIEHFEEVLSPEGEIRNIDSEMNEASHQAFINMQKEFHMTTITIDALILTEKTSNSNLLTIAKNINYLIGSGFHVTFVLHSLSNRLLSAIIQFMKFYFRRFIETLDKINFSIKVQSSKESLIKHQKSLARKLHEEVGSYFNITIDTNYSEGIKYFPALYDSFVLAPFAMDELFHPENWKNKISFSLIDAVDENGYILSGGNGLLSWNGIKKPWWHAYAFISKLKGKIISKGNDHIITNNNQMITILTYNTCSMPATYLQAITTDRELFDMIQNKGHIREHNFQLLNLFGSYKIITYSINETACLFSKWAKLGYPEYLTMEEERIFEQICHPEVSFDTVESTGKIDICITEKSFGVTCVILEKYN